MFGIRKEEHCTQTIGLRVCAANRVSAQFQTPSRAACKMLASLCKPTNPREKAIRGQQFSCLSAHFM